MVQISLELHKEGLDNLDTMGKEVRRSVVSDATQDMTRFLQRNSPRDHGLLASWFIQSLSDEAGVIKSPAFYAIYQDQGTKAHMIRPKNKKALYWTGSGLTHSMFYAGGMMHNKYTGAFSKGHMVSGIKGKHFVDKSFNQLKPRMSGYLAKALERSG